MRPQSKSSEDRSMSVNYMCKKLNVNISEALFNDKLIKVHHGAL